MIKPPVVRIQPSTVYRSERILPIEGDIVVRVGDNVQPDMPIARVVQPSPPVDIPAASVLGVRAKDLAAYLVKQVGDRVQQGNVIARKNPTMLQGRRECLAPIEGTIEYISYDTGNITIRRSARPTVIWAEAVGKVTGIVPKQAVIIETGAALVQAAFGLGPEVYGQLKVLGDRPDSKITADQIDRSCRGYVLVVGGIEDDTVIQHAQTLGVKGLILGGIGASGHEKWPSLGKDFPLTIIVTDGFGAPGIFPPAFDIFRHNQERKTWLRPSFSGKAEVVILLPDESTREAAPAPALVVGSRVRLLRQPFAGLYGRIVALPKTPRSLESGIRTLVAEMETADSKRVVAPLANLELIW